MRIVVFSDSHKNYSALERVVLTQPGAGLFLHLGDGEEEFQLLQQAYPGKVMQGVAGNNDWGSTSPLQRLIEWEGKRIYLTHGHLHRSPEGFAQAAREQGAHIALCGHSHVARTEYRDGLYIMNPGSVARPRSGPASYGFIDITPAGIVTKIVPLKKGGF